MYPDRSGGAKPHSDVPDKRIEKLETYIRQLGGDPSLVTQMTDDRNSAQGCSWVLGTKRFPDHDEQTTYTQMCVILVPPCRLV